MPIVINDVIVHMEPNNGADIRVIKERQYKALKRKSYEDIVLKISKTTLSTLQNELQVKASLQLQLTTNQKEQRQHS